ncbi:MAG: virulence RhuM family protein, partial [Hyphomicrobiaceae bacterium]|nr:virulence RhuM family protein [Hyphomicrobiaceae bacterium]
MSATPEDDDNDGTGDSGARGLGELVLYRTEDGRDQFQLRVEQGSVWMTQAEIAALFETTPQNITQHTKAIYKEGELDEDATCKKHLQVRTEGGRQVQRSAKLFNLQMILAVGYRVRSPRGTQFRRFATTTLNEYLIKGFVMNDERLKEPGGLDYFDELLERIRDIRTSEKRFYQKVRDLFALTSADYDAKSDTAKTFFASIQNKLVFAVTGKTAAELIVARANPAQPNMALTSWKGERVRKGDVTTSKNYLNADEISELNLLTTSFLDFAELRARNRQQTTMSEWLVQTDRFVAFNERGVLQGAGRVSAVRMEQIAHERYDAFDLARRATELETSE